MRRISDMPVPQFIFKFRLQTSVLRSRDVTVKINFTNLKAKVKCAFARACIIGIVHFEIN